MTNHRTFALLAASIAMLGTVGGLLGTTALAQDAAPVARNAPRPARGNSEAQMVPQTTGEAIYNNVCAACHMPDAKGAQGAGFYPALAGNTKLAAKAYPAYVVIRGLNGMPPVGEMMNDAQVAEVANYVRTHFGNSYKDTLTPEDVAALRSSE